MNKNHIGTSVFEDVKRWEKDPAFKKAVEEHVEKAKLAQLLKQVRGKENCRFPNSHYDFCIGIK